MALFGHLHQRPIKSEGDLKGLKMRVYDGTGLAFGKATGSQLARCRSARSIPP